MEKQQIQGEILRADLNRVFGADEAEIAPQLSDETAKILQEGCVEISLGVFLGQAQEFERVDILEKNPPPAGEILSTGLRVLAD